MSSTLGRAAVVVSAGILVSRLLGFLRDVVLAALLGRGVEADLYTAAFAIPDYLFFLMAGGYLTITFVPILSRHLAQDDGEAANRSFTAVFRVVVAAMAVLTVATMLVARPLTEAVFPEIPADRIPQLTSLVRIVLPAQLFFVAGSILMAVQYAHRRFLVPTLAPIVYNIGIIAGGLASASMGDVSPAGFVWGALGGAIAGNFLLQWWGARSAGARLVGGVPLLDRSVPEYFGLALPLMLGQSAVALDDFFPRVFGQFGDPGSLAGLNYARRVNMVPVGIIAQAAGVASYPFLARLVAEGKPAEMRATVVRAIRSSLVVAALASAATVALAVPGIQVAFQRGAFEPSDTREVAVLLAIYGLTIPLWAAHQVYTRGFYAQRRMWLPVGVGTAVTVAAVPLYWAMAVTVGARGVAWASVVVMVLYTAGIGWFWHREAPFAAIGSTLWRTAVAGIAAGLAAWGVVQLTMGGEPGGAAVAGATLAGGGLVAALAYLGALRLLGREDLELIPLRRRTDP